MAVVTFNPGGLDENPAALTSTPPPPPIQIVFEENFNSYIAGALAGQGPWTNVPATPGDDITVVPGLNIFPPLAFTHPAIQSGGTPTKVVEAPFSILSNVNYFYEWDFWTQITFGNRVFIELTAGPGNASFTTDAIDIGLTLVGSHTDLSIFDDDNPSGIAIDTTVFMPGGLAVGVVHHAKVFVNNVGGYEIRINNVRMYSGHAFAGNEAVDHINFVADLGGSPSAFIDNVRITKFV